MIAFVCLDFSKFIAVKMRSTLKLYFLGGFGEDLRRRTGRTSSKNLPKQAKIRLLGLMWFESRSAKNQVLKILFASLLFLLPS